MPLAYRLICTGSRLLSDPALVRNALRAYLRQHHRLSVYVGDCPTGADLYVRQWCMEQLPSVVDVHVFRADWRAYGKHAGPRRNQAMVDAVPRAHLCVAWWQLGAPNRGTADCVRRAFSAGIAVDQIGQPRIQMPAKQRQETLLP